MNFQTVSKIFADARLPDQQHHVGRTIKATIFGREIEGQIVEILSGGVVYIQQTPNGIRYRLTGINLPCAPHTR